MTEGQPAGDARVSFGRFVDVGLLLAALSLGAVLVHREFGSSPAAGSSQTTDARPTYEARAESVFAVTHVSGNRRAAVRVLVFNDLECPFCARFHETLRQVASGHPESVSVGFVHYPIPTHRFARPAAIAAECAGKRGRFEEMVRTVFAKQDSIGLLPWSALALNAGVVDTTSFKQCLSRPIAEFPSIAEGTQLGHSFGVRGTPTVFVNGWRLSAAPDSIELERVVSSLEKGKLPFDGNH